MVTTRNAFIDPIEDPDTNTKILAKDGTDAAGYVTVGDLATLISGSEVGDLGPLPTTATNPMSLPEADITQSLATWINSLTPKLFYKEPEAADYNDAQFAWGSHLVAYLDLITHETEDHAPQVRATASIVRHTEGSGTFGANSGDYSTFIVGRKDNYLTSTIEGEVGGCWAATFQGKFGDASCYLADCSKIVEAGGTGGIAAIEAGGRQVASDGTTIKLIKGFVGHILQDGFGHFGGGACAFYAEPQTGPATVLYFGTSLDATCPYDYALMFNKDRDLAKTYFTVDSSGNIMQGLPAGRRTFGMNGTTWEVKNTAGTVIMEQADTGALTITGMGHIGSATALLGGWTLNNGSGYSTLTDVGSQSVFGSGPVADPTNYYTNTNHAFRNRVASFTMAHFSDSLVELNVPMRQALIGGVTLTVNNRLQVTADSDTLLRFNYRGTDGTTRSATMAIA